VRKPIPNITGTIEAVIPIPPELYFSLNLDLNYIDEEPTYNSFVGYPIKRIFTPLIPKIFIHLLLTINNCIWILFLRGL
jgi:hypothetical protein